MRELRTSFHRSSARCRNLPTRDYTLDAYRIIPRKPVMALTTIGVMENRILG